MVRVSACSRLSSSWRSCGIFASIQALLSGPSSANPFVDVTLDKATYVRLCCGCITLEEQSMMQFAMLNPCALCMVRAYAGINGSWCLEPVAGRSRRDVVDET